MTNAKKKKVFIMICWILLCVLYIIMAPVTAFAVSFNSSNSAAPNFLNSSVHIPENLPFIILIVVSIPVIVLFIMAFGYAAKEKTVPLGIKIPLFILTLPFIIVGVWLIIGEFVIEPINQAIKSAK